MIELAVAVDFDDRLNSIVETNSGNELLSHRWPQDSEAQVVCYRKGARTCRVVSLPELQDDIESALRLIKQAGLLGRKKPGWFDRLRRCSDAEETRGFSAA